MSRALKKSFSADNVEEHEEILDLVARIKLGDSNAFEQIVRKYEQRIRAYCAMMLSSQEAGEDAAQEVLIKAYQKLGSFRAESSFTAWLIALARNQCIDELRKRRSRPTTSIENLEEEGAFLPAPSSSSPEAADLLRKTLETLPPHHRELVLLKELYGFSYEEIGQSRGLSLDAVKGQLKRAREKIEESLRHFLSPESVKLGK